MDDALKNFQEEIDSAALIIAEGRKENVHGETLWQQLERNTSGSYANMIYAAAEKKAKELNPDATLIFYHGEKEGEYSTEYWFIEATNIQAARNFLKDRIQAPMKGTHCIHSHDCCGHWYARPVFFELQNQVKECKKFLFSQSWAMNV